MSERYIVFASATFLVFFFLISLFLFFKFKSVRYYSCTYEETGKVFSLKLQKKENLTYVKIKNKNIDTFCEPFQGMESTYKCRIRQLDYEDSEVRREVSLMVVGGKGEDLMLFLAINLVRIPKEALLYDWRTAEIIRNAWKRTCAQAGGKSSDGVSCVIIKRYANCKQKRLFFPLVSFSYLRELLK